MDEEAQIHELDYWQNVLATPEQRAEFLRTLDYGTEGFYLPWLVKWIGVWRPEDIGVEIGMGPCGLMPWMRLRTAVGIDPLADAYEALGIDYFAIGYNVILTGTAEDASRTLRSYHGFDPERIDVILCCNMLDHTSTPLEAIAGIAALGHKGTDAFLAYDLRTVGTDLHPSLLPDGMVLSAMGGHGWGRMEFTTEPPHPAHINESAGRRIEHYRKERE